MKDKIIFGLIALALISCMLSESERIKNRSYVDSVKKMLKNGNYKIPQHYHLGMFAGVDYDKE